MGQIDEANRAYRESAFIFPNYPHAMIGPRLLGRKDDPLRIGLIGAGKFAAMYLAQVPKTPGIRLVKIADLNPANARTNLERVGWAPEVIQKTSVVEDWQQVVSDPQIDIVMLDGVDHNSNPVGSKGVGELGICGSGAAIANAIFNATGIRVRSFPITLDKILVELSN